MTNGNSSAVVADYMVGGCVAFSTETETTMIPDIVWIMLAVTVGVLEAWAIWASRGGKERGTISHLVRRTFRTHTLAGRLVFGVAWLGFAGWVFWHIVFQGA